MAKTLHAIQSISGEGELHRGAVCLGRVVYGFNSDLDVESADARADIKVHSNIDLWELLQQNAELTLHLNDGRRWACRVGLIIDLLLGRRASLVGRAV